MNESLLQLMTATLGSLGFALLFRVRGKHLAVATAGGLLSWLVYLAFVRLGVGEILSNVISAAAVTAYARVCAGRFKAPVTVYLIVGLVPLIPGKGLYQAMLAAVQGDVPRMGETGLKTMMLALGISAGVVLVTTAVHIAEKVQSRPGRH